MAILPNDILPASHAPAARLVVVAPTFDNARTLRAVLDGVAAHGLPIIVTDDGSTDGTAIVLEQWQADPSTAGARIVVRHAVNQGKAAAMRSGFERALSLGYTHALTIDTDGQHDPADIAPLRRQFEAHPQAIILGSRPMDGVHYPTRSRVGRFFSNLLVWLIGGVRVDDSQCGLRIYPLELVRQLGARTSRYAFETEVLAHAGWAAVPVVEVPIRCIYDLPDGRITHFRPWRDSLSAAWMHTRLLTRSMLPWPTRKLFPVTDDLETGTLFERTVRWMNPLRTWRKIRIDHAERDRVAASMGWGVFVANQPAFGLKTLLCLLLAKVFGLQPLVVMGTSSLATPPVGFALWTLSIVAGHLLLHGTLPDLARYDLTAAGGAWPALRALAAEWILGALVTGAALAFLTYTIARLALQRMPMHADGPTRDPAAIPLNVERIAR